MSIDLNDTNMKPLLGALVQRAVVLAISDCIRPPDGIDDVEEYEKRKAEVQRNVFSILAEDWAQIDPMALAQNVACRLLGAGGWTVNGVYSGNATINQIVNACFGAEASRDPLADVKEALSEIGAVEAIDPD